jgi:hypothetical protein
VSAVRIGIILERIGLLVMWPFRWLAELLLEIPEVERATGWVVERLAAVLPDDPPTPPSRSVVGEPEGKGG